MLHAMSKNKTPLHRRYLGERSQEEARVNMEDEITSTLLGPLCFLPDSCRGWFWYNLLTNNCNHVIANSPPERTEIKLWPRRQDIEPDIHITMFWPDGSQHALLVELKWKSPLSGERQLHKQWLEYLTEEERQHATHLFIGIECSQAYSAVGLEDVWQGKLKTQTWHQIISFLSQLSESDPNAVLLEPWATQVQLVLGKLGILPLSGFKGLPAFSPTSTASPIFWKGLKGFTSLPTPQYSSNSYQFQAS